MQNSPSPPAKFGVALRIGIFVLIAVLGLMLFPTLINFLLGSSAIVVTSTMGTFAAAAVANAIPLRIYERGRLSDIGLGWNPDSRRNFALGLLGGIGAALCVLVFPILARWSELEPDPAAHMRWPNIVFLSVVLFFGAAGEELLFRGYAFQVLANAIGPFATILPFAVLFGAAHMNNRNVTPLGLVNTGLWGVLLGVSFFRSGDLWLPIGLHYGWNWTLPLLGSNLSGFTMNVTGYGLHWRLGEIWSGGAYGPEGGLVTTFVVLALFAYLYRAPIQTQEAYFIRDNIL